MSYLDNFGVSDARREKRRMRIALSLLAIVAAGGVLWFLLRDYQEVAKIKDFLALLQAKDYKAAHALWGCTDATPCRDYSMERFLQDWGPQSDAADAASIVREKVKSCDGGIIQVLRIKGQEVNLFVDRPNRTLGFSPWPVCNPRVKL